MPNLSLRYIYKLGLRKLSSEISLHTLPAKEPEVTAKRRLNSLASQCVHVLPTATPPCHVQELTSTGSYAEETHDGSWEVRWTGLEHCK